MAQTPEEREAQRRATESKLKRRNAAGDKLARLGRTRERLERQRETAEQEILDVVRAARGDITIADAAKVVGVSRATLIRWLARVPEEANRGA